MHVQRLQHHKIHCQYIFAYHTFQQQPFTRSQGSYLPKKRVNKCLWFLIILDLIHLANQSLPIYMDIQIYLKYNDSYRLHVLGKGVGMCVKNLISHTVGEVHCANSMYAKWTKKSWKKVEEKKTLTWISNVIARPCVHQTTCMKYHIT